MNNKNEFSGEDIMRLDLVSHLLKEKYLILNIMIGIPGSGKSFYINLHKNEDDLIISPDEIRKELTGDVSNQSKNKEVFDLAYERLNKSNKDTWFDATNLSIKSIRKILDNAKQFNHINIFIMSDSKNLYLCQRRIANDISNGKDRSNVPEDIVEKMHNKFTQLIKNFRTDELKKEYGNKIHITII